MQLEVQFEEQRLKEMEECWRSADLRERNRRQEEKQMVKGHLKIGIRSFR